MMHFDWCDSYLMLKLLNGPKSQLAYYKWTGVINRLPGCGLTGYPLGFLLGFLGYAPRLLSASILQPTRGYIMWTVMAMYLTCCLSGKKNLNRFLSVYCVLISLKLSNSFKRLSTLLIPRYFGPTLYTKGGGEGRVSGPLLSHQYLVLQTSNFARYERYPSRSWKTKGW